MMKRKLFWAILIAMMTIPVVMLSSCGGDDENDNGNSDGYYDGGYDDGGYGGGGYDDGGYGGGGYDDGGYGGGGYDDGGYGGGGGNTTTKPNAPTNLTATKGGPAMYPYVGISWSSVSNATSYRVYRSGSASGSYSQIGTPTYASYTDNNPLTGNNYYKVKAVNSTGESDYSSYVLCNNAPTTYSPCPPTVTVTKSGISAKVTWSFSTASGCGTPTSIKIEHWSYNSATGNRSTAKTIATSTQSSGSITASEYTSGQSVTNYYKVTGTNDKGSDYSTETISGW